MSDKSARKAYLKELSAIKEYYHPKSQRKFSKNKRWKEEWKGYAEYTFPWDGGDILESIVFRLEVLAANFTYCSHHEGSDAEVKEILQAVALGKKILDEDSYYKDAFNFSAAHCATWYLVYKKKTKDLIGEFKVMNLNDPELDTFGVAKKQLLDWCADNNVRYKDVSVMMRGQWDDPENYNRWTELSTIAAEKRKADVKKFFNLLADKLESWWD